MTNLLATIFLTVTTNWTDVARITPIIPEVERTYLLYRAGSTIRRGQIVTNTIARIRYENRDIDVVLKAQHGPSFEQTFSDLSERFNWGVIPQSSEIQLSRQVEATNITLKGGTSTNFHVWNETNVGYIFKDKP